MRHASRTISYSQIGRENPPQITVSPGEVFEVETELCTGDWLHSMDDLWAPGKGSGCNPAVCVAVQGAKPGDLLAVEILDILPDTIGYTGFVNESNPLANLIMPRDWGRNVKTVRIENGVIHWDSGLMLPTHPMIGTLGTAPASESLSNAKGGVHGGNMDAQEICPGATVYLPVAVDGALLHIGDVHAIQGDGEINCAGGIECRSLVTLRTRILPRPEAYACIRAENDEYIVTIACERSLEESFYLAARQLLCWMVSDYGFSLSDAYLLMGQVMEARATQFVNPTRTYVCKMRKAYLKRD